MKEFHLPSDFSSGNISEVIREVPHLSNKLKNSVGLVLHAEIGAVCADLSALGELRLAEEY